MAPKKKNKKASIFDRMLGRGDYYEEFDEMEDGMEDQYDDEEFEDDDSLLDDEEEEEERGVRHANRADAEDLQINLVDKGKTLVAQAIVPGINEDEIEINLNREMLAIKTNSNEHCIEEGGDYLYEEISFGSFSRSILLPAEIDVEESKAEVRDGVLKIVMPKIDKAAHKKISVKKK